jgi:hypothetical protein
MSFLFRINSLFYIYEMARLFGTYSVIDIWGLLKTAVFRSHLQFSGSICKKGEINMNDVVPRDALVKYGTKAVSGIGGGIILLLLRGLASGGSGAFSLFGLILGGALALSGYAISRNKEDRALGMIVSGVGILTAVSALPIVGGLAGALMWIAGIGLVVGGGINLFKFLRGRKTRM